MPIHSTAIIDPQAQIDESATIGPYCIIGAGVVIGPGCVIGAHNILEGPTIIGAGNRIRHHCSLGSPPQDLGYKGEPTQLIIGERNFIGDYVQISRGTTKTAQQTTRIGNDNFLMAYCHIGHDCVVGNRVIAANSVQLAGHVNVEDRVVFSGLIAVHQFCNIGTMSMIAGGSATAMDIPPFTRVGGWGCAVFGLNLIGLERSGVDRAAIKRIREAYKILFRGTATLKDALETLRTDFADSEHVQHWVRFFEATKRGVVRERENK